MCGIAGILAPREQSAALNVWLDRTLRDIKHRGPDDSGKHVEHGVAFGMCRLSIIDIAGGHQPMYSDDGRYVIVFNGEIYNFIELRETLKAKGHVFRTRSDTEIILKGYMEWGQDVVNSFLLNIFPHEKHFISRLDFLKTSSAPLSRLLSSVRYW